MLHTRLLLPLILAFILVVSHDAFDLSNCTSYEVQWSADMRVKSTKSNQCSSALERLRDIDIECKSGEKLVDLCPENCNICVKCLNILDEADSCNKSFKSSKSKTSKSDSKSSKSSKKGPKSSKSSKKGYNTITQSPAPTINYTSTSPQSPAPSPYPTREPTNSKTSKSYSKSSKSSKKGSKSSKSSKKEYNPITISPAPRKSSKKGSKSSKSSKIEYLNTTGSALIMTLSRDDFDIGNCETFEARWSKDLRMTMGETCTNAEYHFDNGDLTCDDIIDDRACEDDCDDVCNTCLDKLQRAHCANE